MNMILSVMVANQKESNDVLFLMNKFLQRNPLLWNGWLVVREQRIKELSILGPATARPMPDPDDDIEKIEF